MYVAVKGGEKAIAAAHALLAAEGRGAPGSARIEAGQVAGQLGVLVSRVMTEGSLHDPELAARALIQAQGDVLEAVTLLRSYRTTFRASGARCRSTPPGSRRSAASPRRSRTCRAASSSARPSTTRTASSPTPSRPP